MNSTLTPSEFKAILDAYLLHGHGFKQDPNNSCPYCISYVKGLIGLQITTSDLGDIELQASYNDNMEYAIPLDYQLGQMAAITILSTVIKRLSRWCWLNFSRKNYISRFVDSSSYFVEYALTDDLVIQFDYDPEVLRESPHRPLIIAGKGDHTYEIRLNCLDVDCEHPRLKEACDYSGYPPAVMDSLVNYLRTH